MSNTIYKNIKARSLQLKDGQKSEIVTGLVVQGGGMRGIYSMSALMALEECGLGLGFDHVFGSSAGAINSAYMLAEQAKMAVSVYLDDISNKNFINFLRLKKVVDIDFLVDRVLKKHKTLDIDKVKNSDSILHIILTDYLTSDEVIVTNRDKNVDLMEAIRATAAMPILYNKVVKVDGRGYIDGGIRDGVPLIRAIEAGCTDIIVVLTREPNYRRHQPGFMIRFIENQFLRSYPEKTRELILSEVSQFNRTMEIIERPDIINFKGRLTVIYPSDMKQMVSRTTNNRNKLLPCALMARNDTRVILGLEPLYDNPWE